MGCRSRVKYNAISLVVTAAKKKHFIGYVEIVVNACFRAELSILCNLLPP